MNRHQYTPADVDVMATSLARVYGDETDHRTTAKRLMTTLMVERAKREQVERAERRRSLRWQVLRGVGEFAHGLLLIGVGIAATVMYFRYLHR